MNGFASHGLDEAAFGEKGSIVKAFDAFRKSSRVVQTLLRDPLVVNWLTLARIIIIA
jgi:hypothetical protein